nr:T9SS type A sorting domain-containing protein [Bacteroidota bacterium]
DATGGGSPVHVGQTFTTPVLTGTTAYFVEAFGGNCFSQKVEVLAVIDPLPPIPSAINVERCGPGTLELTATGGIDFNWYASSSATSPLAAGAVFTTPILSATTSYYLASFDGTCESNRFMVDAFIKTVPATSMVILIDNTTLQSSETGIQYQWKQDGIILPDNSREITVGQQGIYTVSVEGVNGCWSLESEDYNYSGSSIEKYALESMQVYPNPALNSINISFSQEVNNVKILMMDILGKVVVNEQMDTFTKHKEIDISHLNAGIYYLKVNQNEKSRLEKILVR